MKITFTVEPSFEPSYTVILNHDEFKDKHSYTLTLTESFFGEALLLDPERSLRYELSKDQWDGFLKLLAIRINLLPEETMGFDGTTVTLSVEAGWNTNSIKCWECDESDHPIYPFKRAVEKFISLNKSRFELLKDVE